MTHFIRCGRCGDVKWHGDSFPDITLSDCEKCRPTDAERSARLTQQLGPEWVVVSREFVQRVYRRLAPHSDYEAHWICTEMLAALGEE